MAETESFPDAKCIRETAKAILVMLDDDRNVWIPKSVIDDDSEVYKDGTDGVLIVQRWFAEKEGLS
jgi:hypothetical protein